MQIRISTKVAQSLESVQEGFTAELFVKLNPPFPIVKVLKFDGCRKGDFVELLLDFKVSKQKWVSEITFNNETEKVFEFIDEGMLMPFPFSSWKHHHMVIATENGCQIIDQIDYQTKNKLITFLMYPLLFLQFLYRKPVYRKVFK